MNDAFPHGFARLLASAGAFRPRTPAAGHRALKLGLWPAELYVALVNDIRPLLEEPYDLDEIDRILARPHLDHATALLLAEIFETLSRHEDPEVALFAAEGVNLLEGRYDRAVRGAQAAVAAQPREAGPRRRLAAALVRLADLHRPRPVIRRFYLEEALGAYRAGRPWLKLRLADTLRLADLHRQLGRPDRALVLLRRAEKFRPGHPRLALALADAAFRAGDPEGAAAALAAAKPGPSSPPILRSLGKFWGLT